MPSPGVESEHHEESETFQAPGGRWQNYYGGGPGMGMRIPLEPSTSYPTSGAASQAAQARSDQSVIDAPAPGLAPGMGVLAPGIPAAQILGAGSAPDLARTAAALMPMPDADKVRAAEQEYADAKQSYLRTGEGYQKLFATKANETDLAAKQYEEQARRLLPQTAQVQPAPPRSLRGFLAPTKDEDPYTTVSKFMQSMTLLATMMGGGRNGARASISALTGAVEGWTKGDRYRADSEYQAWKDNTDALFKQFDDEMRRYNSIMIAERVPLETKLRALETTAWEHKNAMAQEAFKVNEAGKAVAHFDKMREAFVGAQFEAAKIQGSYDNAQQKHQEVLARLAQQTDQFNKELGAKFAGMELKRELQELANKQQILLLNQKIEAGLAGANLGKAGAEERKKWDDYKNVDTVLGKLDELMQSPKVNLRKIVGGINPWVNSFIQKWGNGKPIPEGATADPIDTKRLGTLTEEERQFLALLKNYGDRILRQRSGAAISIPEMGNLLQFVADPSQAPEVIRSRLALAKQENTAQAENFVNTLREFRVAGPTMADFRGARMGGGQASAPAPGSKLEGNEWVSESGKFVWRNGAWVAR